MTPTLLHSLKGFGLKATVMALGVAMMIPAVDASAQHRPGRGEQSRQEQKHQHGNNRDKHQNNGQRPGNSKPGNGKPGGNNRPGNNGPGHNSSGPNRPGNNRPGNNRPGNGGPGHSGPGNGMPGNWRPAPPPAPGRPGPSAWRPAPPPHRPGRPPIVAWRPPVPPPAWRPGVRGPSFSTVLGVTLGTALANTVNALISAGYNVDGYQDGTVYLRGINSYNYYWPDATMRYNPAGALIGAEYLYTTQGYDLSRYTGLYNQMYGLYGIPAISSSPGSGTLSATWFGPNNCYITVKYQPVVINGIQNFCTSLTQGLY